MANEVRPVYGPAPPPDSYDTTSPLLLYSSHRNQRRASVFKRAALASKRKVRAVAFEELLQHWCPLLFLILLYLTLS